jgi:DtxR family Mn-dependent transcriptional regulator
MLTQADEDYLKVIYQLGQEQPGQPVTTQAIAARMNVQPASVTNMMKKLAHLRLLEHTPYRGVELTPAGQKAALEVIRHHRLMELYLSEVLGLPWDKVHAEAERLEHVLSDELEDRIAAKLGYPTTDPHGDPIPTKEGVIQETPAVRLADLPAGAGAVVRRVPDRDPALLRYLGDIGLVPEARIDVLEILPFDGPIVVRVGAAGTPQYLGRELAAAIRVEPIAAPQPSAGERGDSGTASSSAAGSE